MNNENVKKVIGLIKSNLATYQSTFNQSEANKDEFESLSQGLKDIERLIERSIDKEPTIANVSDLPKFQMISKREYFDLQVKFAIELTPGTDFDTDEVADYAREIVDNILTNNEIEVEGQNEE